MESEFAAQESKVSGKQVVVRGRTILDFRKALVPICLRPSQGKLYEKVKPMERTVRCQGAIIREGRILLVKHVFHGSDHTYWWLPGGGQRSEETQEECVVREVKEETNLDVRVERLLFEKPDTGRHHYRRYATYLCAPLHVSFESGEWISMS